MRFGRAIRGFVIPARGLSLLEETAWQRGKREASELANGRAILFMIVCAPIFALGGLFFALTGFWWPLRVFLAALIGLAVAVVAAFAVSGYYALRAPYRQRKEAREYARALETHVREYAEWARRREIADDFRRETLEHVRVIGDGQERRSASELDHDWRATVANVIAQLLAHGASDNTQALIEIDAQLRVLDAKEDGYGDDEIARIRNSMATTSWNVWSAMRGARHQRLRLLP